MRVVRRVYDKTTSKAVGPHKKGKYGEASESAKVILSMPVEDFKKKYKDGVVALPTGEYIYFHEELNELVWVNGFMNEVELTRVDGKKCKLKKSDGTYEEVDIQTLSEYTKSDSIHFDSNLKKSYEEVVKGVPEDIAVGTLKTLLASTKDKKHKEAIKEVLVEITGEMDSLYISQKASDRIGTMDFDQLLAIDFDMDTEVKQSLYAGKVKDNLDECLSILSKNISFKDKKEANYLLASLLLNM